MHDHELRPEPGPTNEAPAASSVRTGTVHRMPTCFMPA